ncbi:hypothetical protein JCM6882_005376 [Rhodosporidiobolus microsporus]
MASASPPPPPDPNRPSDPFRSSCSSSSSPARPALRRSKTLANPESPTTWRREPLVDVTNAVLGREHLGRLQRVPLDGDLLPLPSASDGPSASPLPVTPSSRIPRRALRRTRSAAPTMGGGGPGPSSSPSGGGDHLSLAAFAPPALPADGLASPPRELRPRPPRPAASLAAGAAGSRRTRSASFGGGSGGGASSSLAPIASTSTATPSRRRTFGGVGLAAVLEDPADEEDAPASTPVPTPTPTPRTRSRARGLDDEGGEDGDEGADGASENERRLRRRRTTGSAPVTPSSTRRGLR